MMGQKPSPQVRDLTLQEAAALLGVSSRTVRRLIARGALKPIASNPVRVPREAVELLRELRDRTGRFPLTRPVGRPRKDES